MQPSATCSGVVCAGPAAFIRGAQPTLAPPVRLPRSQVLYCGLLTIDATLLMEVFALQDVSSVDAAIIYTLEPVLGAAFAWALLGERLGPKGMAGAALILGSSLLSQVLGGEPRNEEGEEGEGKPLGDKAE